MGVHYDPTSGVARPTADGKRRLIRGRGSLPGSVVLFDPRIPAEGQRPLLLPTDEDKRYFRHNRITQGGGGVLQWFPPESR